MHTSQTRKIVTTLAFAVALASSQAVLAWDGSVAGYIVGADVTDGPNYAFRIDLQGTPAMCGGTSTWAYVNSDNANYHVYVAALLAAKASGAHVTVYSSRDAGTGYCRIGYVRTTT